ncbi:MAG: Coenzyme F420 hydrogenase/dehydrogenase, beta subunit C-terminal domain [Pseudomonadota bacterium]
MTDLSENRGQAWLRERVLDAGLCTGCAACVGLCPYQGFHRDHTAIIHACDRPAGRCQAYCPRAPLDLAGLRAALYDPADLTPELGAVKGLYVTRAADPELRQRAQHGGTVSALTALALTAGLTDCFVLADQDARWQSRAGCARTPAEAMARAGSKFAVAPTVGMFNQASLGPDQAIGVVATPCQALALAKMRARPAPGDEARVAKLKLVIGLFCGWALDWEGLNRLAGQAAPGATVLGMDIPPSQHQCMELMTDRGLVSIPMDQVQGVVRESCRFCFDLTCEFADLSVGSSRSPAGWEVDRGWNQVLVRSAAGQELLDLARSRRALEFAPVPEGNLAKLKRAALGKKRTCLTNLEAKFGADQASCYLNKDEFPCR